MVLRAWENHNLVNAAPTEEFVPFFFGDKQLFGNYHTPSTSARDGVAVLCYSFAGEYIHSHRTYRQLATRLARIGLPTLRFDYYATGDSAGEDVEATLDQWITDTHTAIAEAQRRSGSQRVFLVGLRMGAVMAARAAAERDDVAGLVLWEPAVSGSVYWDDISEWHEHKLRYLLARPAAHSDDLIERLGMVMSHQMVADMQAIDLTTQITRKPAQSALVIESEEHEPVKALCHTLESLGTAVEYLHLDGPIVWRDDPDKALVPHQILQAIVGWMSTV